MKLQTKLTLLFSCLLLVTAGAIILGLHFVSDVAARNTAESTLKKVVATYAGTAGDENDQHRGGKSRNYDDGVYLQVYSSDGKELLTGTDVFGIAGLMPALVQENTQGEVFRIDTEEAGVYCYFLWRTADTEARGHSGKTGGQKESRSAVSDEEESAKGQDPDKDGYDMKNGGKQEPSADDSQDDEENISDGMWVIGVLPVDSMENVMDSFVNLAWIGLLVIVVFASIGGWVIAGRSLRPLRRITDSARDISDGYDLSRRIELPSAKDEVHELADTFNDMMGRLELSFEAERQFSSDASHELRTPAAVILAECEMAEKMPEDAEAAQESIAEIHKQTIKMSEIISKLLSYTRLEQGTQRIDKEALDLSELVTEVCEEQGNVMAGNIQIICSNESGVMVNGDAALLISLLQNLLSNAVKYGKDGGHVYVRAYRSQNKACVSVRDDGIGISKEDLGRIWNRFYQADRSRSDEKRGIGLGLSLVQQIARLHGGSVSVSSKLGEGSEFIFSMPAL